MRNYVSFRIFQIFLFFTKHITYLCRLISAWFAICFFLPFEVADAAEKIRGQALQGDLLVFKTDAGTQLNLDGAPLPLSPTGYFAFGFHRDDSMAVSLDILSPDGRRQQIVLTPKSRLYDIQRIDNLPGAMVTPPQEVLDRIRRDARDVKAARAIFSEQEDALVNNFDWPVWGRISGIYGCLLYTSPSPRDDL